MNMPNFTAEVSLSGCGGHYLDADRSAQKRTRQSRVEPAIPPRNGNGGPDGGLGITCTACSSTGFQTCTDHETGEKTTRPCTSCGACAVSQALGSTLGTFVQTCTTGGQSSTKPCTFCKDFPISTPWPLPDICLRLCISSLLNPNTWTLTQC
jgi:hypothetical protein